MCYCVVLAQLVVYHCVLLCSVSLAGGVSLCVTV